MVYSEISVLANDSDDIRNVPERQSEIVFIYASAARTVRFNLW